MFNFAQWPLRRLLLLGFSLLMIALLGVAAAGFAAQDHYRKALQTVYADRTVPLGDLGKIHYLEARNRILLQDAVARGEVQHAENRLKEFDANTNEIDRRWKAYMATRLTDEEAQIAARFQEAKQVYQAKATQPTADALRQGRFDLARELLVNQVSPLNPSIVKEMDALIGLQVRVADEEYQQAETFGDRISVASMTITVLGLLLGATTSALIVRGVMRRLGDDPARLAHVVGRFASGDLTPIPGAQSAPVGSVLASIAATRASLAEIVDGVRRGNESIAAASTQIAQGGLELSSRTEAQASALEQTAASMEQLGSTVRQNADNARQANHLAERASSIAVDGGETVAQAVQAMKDIDAGSRKIEGIISVIDGIAFQTNILALNAAVEAARAGDQGRGFAVVAAEVRSLAQRSAAAAREIKTLISTSVQRTAQGAELVDRAGQSMQDVVTSIQRVTQIMSEISAASAEQSAGVAQVGEAVMQLDQATQQNAALVEESAAAADSLKLQAQQLVQAVAVFKL